VVRPVWETYEVQNEDIVFAINPGSVFGTGLHQTTKLCIEALEDLIAKKSFIDGGSCVPFIDVLDIGCGSGILMLISLLLGARYALGCDFDPAAADNVRENARLNHINEGCFTVITGDIINNDGLIRMVRQRRYHIVACNIVADAVIGVLRMVKDFMLVDGFFIASGIIGERLDEVVSVALKGGLRINGVTEMGGWYCLVCSVEDNA